MKKSIFTLFVFTFLATQSFATIRRVNAGPGVAGVNVYTTVLAAVNAAVANDTIQLEPFGGGTQNNYNEAITISKKLTFLGVGYNLNNPQLVNPPASKAWCYLQSITFNNGSANSAVIGLYLNSININAPNVTVTRCYTGTLSLNKSTNVIAGVYSYGNNAIITRNLVVGINGLNSTLPDVITGAFISNNVIYGALNTMQNAVIINNILYSNIGNYHTNVANSSMVNNIYKGISAIYAIQDISSTGNSYGYNLVTNFNLLPNGNGNINGADPLEIFVDDTVLGYAPFTNSLQVEQGIDLAPGSLAAGVGSGGIDMGPFGGTTPYLKGGLPPAPIITNATNTGVGNSTLPLGVTVSARSNN